MTSFARLRFAGASGFLFAVAACSAGGDRPGSGGLDPSGGSSGSGGSLPLAGNAGTAPKGGSGGGSAGTLAIAGNTSSGGSGGEAKVCDAITATSRPLVPTVALVVDNSSSMYEPPEDPPFPKLYEALMDPSAGAIQPLESKVRFGFFSFRGVDEISVPEDDESCAEVVTVPFNLDNYSPIQSQYASIGADGRGDLGCSEGAGQCATKDWETPTGHVLQRVTADLLAYNPDPPGKKYILMITDGTPNTCQVANPNCGQDLALKAVQDAYAAGIETFVIGIGDVIDAVDSGCTADTGRCGPEYLQDVANAGVGQPVEPPIMNYWYQQCATRESGTNPGTPRATYAPSGGGATERYYTAMDAAELVAALNGLLSDVVSCTFDMNAYVTGDPTNSQVLLNGTPLAYGDTAGGWTLESNKYQVTLQGTACDTFKSASQGGSQVDVSITFYCDAEGNPIAEPR